MCGISPDVRSGLNVRTKYKGHIHIWRTCSLYKIILDFYVLKYKMILYFYLNLRILAQPV